MNNILEVNNISKVFKDYTSEWQRVFAWFGLKSKPLQEHSILKHINFSIIAGEAIGIVGQNGAGKSTLLKIIVGTLKPTAGNIQINGRVSAILELGMAFHPDLTGQQNVYHTAGIMGFSKAQIDAAIEDIAQFAEIGDYFNQPVRTYSSGMQMRVAFAVATMYRPAILIIDEALSVGDSYFQHKSTNRIKEFQKAGTTLLLVSHDKGAIQAICDRAILLDNGTILKDGKPEAVMDYYNALIAAKENTKITQIAKEDGKIQTISGTGQASIQHTFFYNEKNEPIEYLAVGEKVTLKIKVKINEDLPQIVLGFMIKDRLGQEIYGTNTYHQQKIVHNPQKGEEIEFMFSFNINLGVGSYSVTTALHADDKHISSNYEWIDQALIFNVVNINKQEFIGSAWLDITSVVNRG